MLIDKQIAALSGDRPRQRRLQRLSRASLAGWLETGLVRSISRDLERFADGAAFRDCLNLAKLLQSHDAASHFVKDWSEAFVGQLADEPLSEIDFRHNYAPGLATMQLVSRKGASLSLLAYEEIASPISPASAIFADCDQYEIVIAGGATAITYREIPGNSWIETQSEPLEAGSRLVTESNSRSREIRDVTGRLLVLQLSRVPSDPGPTREIRLCDGGVLMQFDGDKRVSQQTLAMAVLGELQRRDALPVLTELAASGPDHLRWEALRHVLALDARSGMKLLHELSSQECDSLAAPAGKLSAHLAETFPALAVPEAR